jgi:hypothetical protein
MGDKPSLAVYDLAHRVRIALADANVRDQVRECVHDILSRQWSVFKDVSDASCSARRANIEALKATYRGEQVDIPKLPEDSNPGSTNRLDDWPFPIEHGIEESPGSILHLAALNDFAARNKQRFLKFECEFVELLPFGESGERAVGPWMKYGTLWVDAVGELKSEHFERFGRVIYGALALISPKQKQSHDTLSNSSQIALAELRRIARQLEDLPELPLSSVALYVWQNPDGLSTEDAAGFLARPIAKVDYVCGTAWLNPTVSQSIASNAMQYRGCIAAGICPQMPRPWLPDKLTVSAGFEIESLRFLASAGCALMRVSGMAKELWGEQSPDESVLRGNCGLVVWLSALVELANRNTFVGNVNNELVSKLWHWRRDYERKLLHTCWPGSDDELLDGFDKTRTAALINRPIAASRQALVWALDWAANFGGISAFCETDQTENHKAIFAKIVQQNGVEVLNPRPETQLNDIIQAALEDMLRPAVAEFAEGLRPDTSESSQSSTVEKLSERLWNSYTMGNDIGAERIIGARQHFTKPECDEIAFQLVGKLCANGHKLNEVNELSLADIAALTVDIVSQTLSPPVEVDANGTPVKAPTDSAKKLPLRVRKAWASWKLVEDNHQSQPGDRTAYDWLSELDDEKFVGDLVGYELPDFPTWRRYVTQARNNFGENKHTPRTGRADGSRSIVHSDEL